MEKMPFQQQLKVDNTKLFPQMTRIQDPNYSVTPYSSQLQFHHKAVARGQTLSFPEFEGADPVAG